MDASPFHAGERALQARAGVSERLEEVGRVVVRDGTHTSIDVAAELRSMLA